VDIRHPKEVMVALELAITAITEMAVVAAVHLE
jgi:hypothetical protein